MSIGRINSNSFKYSVQKTENLIKWKKLSLKEKEDKMKQCGEKEQNNEDWKDQQACSYAALICFDVGVDINEENINRLLEGAKLKVKKYWPELFCKLIKSKGLGELIAGSVNSCNSNGTLRNQTQSKKIVNEKEIKKEEKESIAEESSISAAAFFDKTGSSDDSDNDSS